MNIHREEASVTRIDETGCGVASAKQIPFEINLYDALLNEEFELDLEKKRRGYRLRGYTRVKDSKKRIEPKCSHFGQCGGCRHQNMTYADQVNHKQDVVDRLFHPFDDDKTIIEKPLVATDPWHQRNKMEFSFGVNGEGETVIGLHKPNCWGRVFDLNACYICPKWFTSVVHVVKSWAKEQSIAPYIPSKHTGVLQTLTCRYGFSTGESMIVLGVNGNNQPNPITKLQIDALIDLFKTHTIDVTSFFINVVQAKKGQRTQHHEFCVHGSETIKEDIKAKEDDGKRQYRFEISPKSFFQPNPILMQSMIQWLNNEIEQFDRNDVMLDLFWYRHVSHLFWCVV